MNDINSFTFYKGYFELIDTIPIKDKKEVLCAIVDFMFKGIEPNLTGHNQAIFNTLRYQLNKSKNKSNNAKKDCEEKKQNEINLKSNQNQNEINKGNITSVLSIKYLVSSFKFNKELEIKIEEWLKYKSERKENYKEMGLKTLLARIQRATSQYGVENVINLIDECMASNYKGIIFEKLKGNKIKPEWIDGENIQEKVATDEEIKNLEERMKRK